MSASTEPERGSGPATRGAGPGPGSWTIPLGAPDWHQFLGYWFCRSIVWCLAHTVHRLRIGNRRAFPTRGGCLLVANHQSHLDVPYLSQVTRRVVHYIARRSLMDHPFSRFLLRCSKSILADRDGADREAFNQAVQLLRMGEVLCIFPEGTRSPDGRVHPFKRGAELIARRAGVPLVPAAVAGTFEAWPRHRKRPRPGRIWIELGRPIPAEELTAGGVELFEEIASLYRAARGRLGLPDLDRGANS